MTETIYALSSGIGRAGVAVIRVSGAIASQLPLLLCGRDILPRQATLVRLRHPKTNDLVDHSLAIWFPAPNSFTGEDVVEFHVHGGRAVVAAILNALSCISGLRAAKPGEFTRRAFMNGKLDLTSAEGLADLIAADTELQRKQAVRQIAGVIRTRVESWRESLLDSLALLEACLDFPDEEEAPVDATVEVQARLEALLTSLSEALEGRRGSEIIRDGAVVLLAGPPNSGKSTLLNCLARRDVSIISEIPGTTRDLIEVTLDIGGLPVTFVDSAGLRETSDPVESQGIARTRARAKSSDLIVWLMPANEAHVPCPIEHTNILPVLTKRDLAVTPAGVLAVSAKDGFGIEPFVDLVYRLVRESAGDVEPSLFSGQRQFDCIAAAAGAVREGSRCLAVGRLELVAEELRTASRNLAELTGEIAVDDVLDRLFARFCMGK